MLLDNNPYVRYVPGGKQSISRLCTVHSISCSSNAPRNQPPTRKPCNPILKREWWLQLQIYRSWTYLRTKGWARLYGKYAHWVAQSSTYQLVHIAGCKISKEGPGRILDGGTRDKDVRFSVGYATRRGIQCLLSAFHLRGMLDTCQSDGLDFIGGSSKSLFMSVVSWGRLQKSYHPMKHVAIFDSADRWPADHC